MTPKYSVVRILLFLHCFFYPKKIVLIIGHKISGPSGNELPNNSNELMRIRTYKNVC